MSDESEGILHLHAEKKALSPPSSNSKTWSLRIEIVSLEGIQEVVNYV